VYKDYNLRIVSSWGIFLV